MELYAEKNFDYMWEVMGGDENSTQVWHDTERDNRYSPLKTTYDQMMLDYVDYATNIEKGNYKQYTYRVRAIHTF